MLADLRNAFTILTVLPLRWPATSLEINPTQSRGVDPARSRGVDPARSTLYFPLVGAFIGGVLLAADAAGGLFSAPVRAALVMIASAAVTGGLHLDGLADTFDGIFSRAGRERALEIMRDSRLGALGAAGLILFSLLKFALLVELESRYRVLTLFLMPVCGRQAMVMLMSLYPYARQDRGLGRAFAGRVGTREIVGSLALSLFTIVAGDALGGAGKTWLVLSLSGFALTMSLIYLLSRYVARRLGGMTGDTYGAANEVAELFLLLFFAAVGKV